MMSRSLVGPLSLALAACASASQPPAPEQFAGWILSSSCSLLVKDPLTNRAIPLKKLQATAYKLYVGQSIKAVGAGAVSLRVYGHELSLTASRGWYRIPASEDQAPKGLDIYKKFTSRAGLPRGEKPNPESIWRADCLINLFNPNRESRVTIRGAVRRDSSQNTEVASTSFLKRGEHVWFEADNKSDVPVYVSVVDIDCAGGVDIAVPLAGSRATRLEAHSGWKRIGEKMTVDLPIGFTSGIEHFRFIATTRPVDFTALRSKSHHDPVVEFTPSSDPLANLLQMSSGSAVTGLADWGIASVDVNFKR